MCMKNASLVPSAFRVLSRSALATVRVAATLAVLVLGAVLAVQPASAQECLEIIVLDPSGAAVPNATVSIGATEQPTDDLGVATFCNLGDGPHSVVVLAQGLAAHEQTLTQSTGEVRIQLALSTVTEQIVVIGSRTEGRAVLESAVPVDIVSAEDFTEQGDPDLVNQLRNTVPSFNVSANPISDAGTIVRPASLRNLAPDHTLLLVNGKRRHRAAIIHWISVGPTDGAQGPDLAVIPSIALRQAEVLRDGASAQYGSDAIAGVMNFVLKDASSGGSMQVTAGGYGAGDGENVTFAGNVGLPLGEGGFANLSIEYGNTDPTDRAIQRYDAQQLIANGNTHVRSPTAQVWGSPRIDDDVKFWGNFGKFVGGTTQFYAHTNYASKRVDGGFYFRNPHTRSAVYSGDGGNTLLVGDVLDAQDGILDGSAGCPTVRVSDGAVLDPGNFAEVKRNPNCFTFHQPFAGAPDGKPGGFTPQFGGDMIDSSPRRRPSRHLCRRRGLGREHGRRLKRGGLLHLQHGQRFHGTRVSNLLRSRQVHAAGDQFQLRSFLRRVRQCPTLPPERNGGTRKFTIGQGDPASYTIGPYAAQGFSFRVETDFNGFGPIAAGRVETAATTRCTETSRSAGPPDSPYTLAGALRGERFADFGSTLNYKIAARVEATEGFAVRGSASSGFRAPTPGQQKRVQRFRPCSAWHSETSPTTARSRPTSPAAALVGGGPLEAEKSRKLHCGGDI